MPTKQTVLEFFGVYCNPENSYDLSHITLKQFIDNGWTISKELKNSILRIYAVSALVGDSDVGLDRITIIDGKYAGLNYINYPIVQLETAVPRTDLVYKLFNSSYSVFATSDEIFKSMTELNADYKKYRKNLRNLIKKPNDFKILDLNRDFAYVQTMLYKYFKDYTIDKKILQSLHDSEKIFIETINMISEQEIKLCPKLSQLYHLRVEFSERSNKKMRDLIEDLLCYKFFTTANDFQAEKNILKRHLEKYLSEGCRNKKDKKNDWEAFLDEIESSSERSL